MNWEDLKVGHLVEYIYTDNEAPGETCFCYVTNIDKNLVHVSDIINITEDGNIDEDFAVDLESNYDSESFTLVKVHGMVESPQQCLQKIKPELFLW